MATQTASPCPSPLRNGTPACAKRRVWGEGGGGWVGVWVSRASIDCVHPCGTCGTPQHSTEGGAVEPGNPPVFARPTIRVPGDPCMPTMRAPNAYYGKKGACKTRAVRVQDAHCTPPLQLLCGGEVHRRRLIGVLGVRSRFMGMELV